MTFKFNGVEEATKALEKVKEDLEKDMKEVLLGGGQLIRGEAVRSIQQGSKSGKTYKKYNPTRTHKASAPGEAPASDTGFLVSNIRVKEQKDVVVVSSEASYSKFLEFGTSKMLARPFLFPAFEKSKPKIAEVIFRKIKQSLDGFGK
jgi:HK97 gp10 family phage protein|tara:strand:- start:575 stop:1015 length:441 start_codon:yes stop_codon:yes gene_type:complete